MKQTAIVINHNGVNRGCLVQLPADYDPSKAYDAILDLHGLGQKSGLTGNPSEEKVKADALHMLTSGLGTGLPLMIKNGLEIDFIVFSPHMNGSGWWDMSFLEKVWEYMSTNFKVRHLILHGISAGGRGVADFASIHPDLVFATIDQAGAKSKMPASLRKNVPNWSLFGSADWRVPASETASYHKDILAAGGTSFYTYLADVGHDGKNWDRNITGTQDAVQLDYPGLTGRKELPKGGFPFGDWIKSLMSDQAEEEPKPAPVPPDTKYKKLPLYKDNIIPLGYSGKDFAMLVDEQDAIDDDGKLVYTPKNPAFSGWKEWAKDQVYIYDFRGDKWIDRIITFDGSGEIAVKVEFGVTPYQFSKPVEFDGKEWNKLVSKPAGVLARYMRISFSGNIGPVEFWAIGESRGEEEPQPTRTKSELPTIGDFLGVNSYVWNPVETVAPFKHIREYSLVDRIHRIDENGNQFMVFTNVKKSSSDYDHYYKTHHEAGKRVMICFTGSPSWIGETYPKDAGWNEDAIPVKYGDHPSDPTSYSELIFRLKETMKRYASVKFPDEELHVMRGHIYNNEQAVFSGVGHMMEYEVGNELEKDWSGSIFYQQPYNMAIMLHECCKARDEVDPSAWIVMPGMTWMNIAYLKAVRLKMLELNNGQIPKNFAVNVHHYSSTGGNHLKGDSIAVSPESNEFYERISNFMEYIETEWKRPVYMSEWGYDVGPSIVGVPNIPGKTPEQTQSDWLLRGILMAAGTGLNRLHVYLIQDWASYEEKYNPALFQTSGVRYKSETANAGEPKISYHTLAELSEKYGDCKVTGVEQFKHEGKPIVKVTLSNGKDKAYAIWIASATNDSVQFENRTITESPLFYSDTIQEEPPMESPKITGSHKNPEVMFADSTAEKSPIGHYDIGYKNVDWYTEIEFPVAIHVNAINYYDAHGDGKAYVKLSEDGTNYEEPIELDLGQYLKWRSIKTNTKVKKARVYGNTTVVPVRVHFESGTPIEIKLYNLTVTGVTESQKNAIINLVGEKAKVI